MAPAGGKQGAARSGPHRPEERVFGTPLQEATTEFAKRNPLLASFVPDFMENAVDVLIPDALEARMERRAQRVARGYQRFKTDFNLGFGEVAAALLRVCRMALARFGVGDVIFGIYHLAQHHEQTAAEDAIDGVPVTDPIMLRWLLYCTTLALAAYCPTKRSLPPLRAARWAGGGLGGGCAPDEVLVLQPRTESTRPAFAMGVDHKARKVVLAFRGNTDLNDMLTDACASCVEYCSGYAHWGMLKAARWFIKHTLPQLRELCDANPGYGVLLVGHSLGAGVLRGVAALVAHLIKQGDPEAGALMKGIKLHAVGVATPAVLTADLAEGCSMYVSSVVLQHDMVPRFSIYNVYALKEEMDATCWQDKVSSTAKDWAVPDVIERSETYRRLVRASRFGVRAIVGTLAAWLVTALNWLLMASVTALHFMGLVRPNRQVADAPPAEAASTGASAAAAAAAGDGDAAAPRTLRDVMASTASAAGLVLHHPGLAAETLAAIERAVAEAAAAGEVHAVYAPGRLFFLKRSDAPKEEQEALRTAAAERRAARQAAREARLKRRGSTGSKAGTASKRGSVAAAPTENGTEESGSELSSEDEDPCPGATFQLIRGSREQRFKRIVLQETCLVDHMCSRYCVAVQRLLDKHAKAA